MKIDFSFSFIFNIVEGFLTSWGTVKINNINIHLKHINLGETNVIHNSIPQKLKICHLSYIRMEDDYHLQNWKQDMLI